MVILGKATPVNCRTGDFMQGICWQSKFREFQEKQIYKRHFQAFLRKAFPGMAIPGNFKKQFHEAITDKAISCISRQGNTRKDNSITIQARKFQARQIQPIRGKAIPGKAISGKSIQVNAISGNSRLGLSRIKNLRQFQVRQF